MLTALFDPARLHGATSGSRPRRRERIAHPGRSMPGGNECQQTQKRGPVLFEYGYKASLLESYEACRRGPGRGPACGHSQCYLRIHGQQRKASLQFKRVLRLSVLLLIRWFRVRPPGAPPAVLMVSRVGSWTDEDGA
jgi:hypothetical protein